MNRKISLFLLFIMMWACLWPLPRVALAAASTLVIDNVNVYEGMNRSYSQGYLPTVQGGMATIVLPLISETPLTGDMLTVRPNLGDTGSSPFVFQNYEKTVQLGDHPVNNGASTVSAYLIRFDLPLSSSRVNGTYPVTLDVQAQTTEGPVTQAYTAYVIISDGADPNATPPASPTSEPVFKPNITIDNRYRYEGMDKSYDQGYVPVVHSGWVKIVLPLVCDGDLYRNELAVTPNLGDTGMSPFVYKNYRKTVRGRFHSVDGGSHPRYAFLMQLELELKADRANGTYPIVLEAQARNSNGEIFTQSFTVYVSITDGKDPNATPPPEPPDLAPMLGIDSENRYEGMDKAYNQGYLPMVSNGKVTIVLPLRSSDALAGNQITVTPDLGSTASSPFIFRNYEKIVPLGAHTVGNDAQRQSAYLVCLELELAPDRVNGNYPVILNIQAQKAVGERFTQSFTTYVTITDGKDPNATLPPEIPPSQPKLMIASHSADPSPVLAGEEFTAKVTVLNTNESRSVKNIKITVSSDPTSLIMLNETNAFYFSKLAAEGTLELEFQYRSHPDTPPGPQKITLAMDYEDTKSSAVSASGEIIIQVGQATRVEAEAPDIPNEVRAGDTLPLSMNVMNLGKSTIYNVRYILEAPGLLPSSAAFIGNMEAGTASTGEMDVFIGTKDMSEGYEGTDKYGMTQGTIKLIYEDNAGAETTQVFEIGTTILEPLIVATQAQQKEEPEMAGQWWISLIIGGVVIAGLVMFLIVRGKQRIKSHEII